MKQPGLEPGPPREPVRRHRRRLLPGFGLSFGITVSYLSLLVLIPLAFVFLRAASMGPAAFLEALTAPRTLAAYRLSFLAALAAAAINAVFGFIIAWVLERYRFPGRRLLDALVDLPFALPTAVAGIVLTALFARDGWIGRFLEAAGIHAVYTPLGVTLALIFIGLPFVVRSVQPVLHDLDPTLEEAAASMGAKQWFTFRRVILPELLPSLFTGFTLALARGLGEYGSVIFIAGNIPMRSEITPLLIVIQLEQYDYAAATAIASVFLVASFGLLLAINLLSRQARRAMQSA
ncbi:MAG: sulfate ABC transporter permease subunit CysT [Candidatus Eisenbacteria bacterium]|uniref:Sulfate transport system permease protein CysT n=1 Tax=Eiseniibacteriota bacterium TaxID=2212470 RepID=A0A948RY10_UNCEI|nr:sulfate ABC transporter permease subunit CysT [Candidatus Eisenbacteria bacterium]MBU1949064.1 sulfate ABC transporter permease subunit CysT [Candidatus Eisenbacteria bacterium]MBU2691167.1 sulfate ABC transporter permease subunit CysT [Candidatus Eisenbacteria bacterium]